MLVDTVFLENGDSLVALLTPLHPLLLWHYIEYTHVIERAARTPGRHETALSSAPSSQSGGVPLFLASFGVPRLVSETAPIESAVLGQVRRAACTSASEPTPAIPRTVCVRSGGLSRRS